MNKFRYLALAISLAALLLAGCKKDEDKDAAPLMAVDASTTADKGVYDCISPVVIKVKISRDKDSKKIDEVKFEYREDTVSGAWVAMSGYPLSKMDADEHEINYDYSFSSKVTSVQYRITATTIGGRQAVKTFTYTLKKPANVTLLNYPSVELGYDPGDQVDLDYFDSTIPRIYNDIAALDVPETIDITYAWTEDGEASLVAPDYRADAVFGDKALALSKAQRTRFKITNLTAAQFGDVEDVLAVKDLYDAATYTSFPGAPDGARVTAKQSGGKGGDLQSGKVLAFRTGKGRFGLILVQTVPSNANTSLALGMRMVN